MAALRTFCMLAAGFAFICSTGCVGPMGAGCCGTNVPGGCLQGACGCSQGGCASARTTECSQCNSCTGCGELYIDPWINHPADCVDPCDACGNYNGQSCGKCRPMFSGVASLWGYRFGCETNCKVGCDGCSTGCDAVGCDTGCGCSSPVVGPGCGCEGPCDCRLEPGCGTEVGCGVEGGFSSVGEEIILSQPQVLPSVPPMETVPSAPTPTKDDGVQVTPAPYRPHRERKIFTPRPNVAHGQPGRPRR